MTLFSELIGRHGGFIFSAYVMTAFVVLGLILWIRMDKKKLERDLAELEAAGIRRRSERQEK